MSFAAVHIPEFPIAAWLHRAPELKGRALVLLRGTAPQQTVASLNAIAKASGIAHGMSKVQAEAVCAAHFRACDPGEEKEAFGRVLEMAGRFSPRVQAIAGPSDSYAGQERLAATLLIDRSGTGSLFGTAQAFAERLHRELASTGFVCNVAIAPNADAALLLARSKNDVTCVERDTLRERLAPLPASHLPCDAKTQALLRRWGVKTLGQLAALPATELISRLGQHGERLQQLACGEAPHLLVAEEPDFTLSAALELESPVEDLERLLFALSRLLGELLRKAVEHAYALRALTITLALVRTESHVVRVAPATPTQSRDTLLKLLNLHLQAHPPPSEVFAIRLEAEPAQPQQAQWGLFQSQFPDSDRLDLLLARLRATAGEHNVGSPQLVNSHREDAFRMVPFRPEHGEPEQPACTQRPALRVLRPPQTVRVRLTDGCPHTFFWRGVRLTVADAAGPWHASGSWWDRSRFDCDYWDVVTAAPAFTLRLQQDHVSGSWNVVGLYD